MTAQTEAVLNPSKQAPNLPSDETILAALAPHIQYTPQPTYTGQASYSNQSTFANNVANAMYNSHQPYTPSPFQFAQPCATPKVPYYTNQPPPIIPSAQNVTAAPVVWEEAGSEVVQTGQSAQTGQAAASEKSFLTNTSGSSFQDAGPSNM